ncbi:MAG: thermonuclease family protein [Atribacterota bacterium]|nr:thermonuclease family protein [Atribacterota bacterium]
MKKVLFILMLITLLSLPIIAQTYQASKVIDGDTIELSNEEWIRYIGINAPELRNGIPDPYSQEAFEANRNLVIGKEAYLEFDVQERERYDRMLAYTYFDDLFIYTWLVENGYTQIMTIPPNVTYQDLLLELQTKTREENRGLWAFNEAKANQEKPQFPYIGNKNSKKFHHYFCGSVGNMKEKNKVFFLSREDAIEAGYVPCKRCKP